MLTEQELLLISNMPKTEYGQALEKWIKEDIEQLEEKEGYASKICDDPLIEDFRVQLGIKLGLKRVLEKPRKCIETLNQKGD